MEKHAPKPPLIDHSISSDSSDDSRSQLSEIERRA